MSAADAGSMPALDYQLEGRNGAKTKTPVPEHTGATLSSKRLALPPANSGLFNRRVGTVGDHPGVQRNIRLITPDLVPVFRSQHRKEPES